MTEYKSQCEYCCLCAGDYSYWPESSILHTADMLTSC